MVAAAAFAAAAAVTGGSVGDGDGVGAGVGRGVGRDSAAGRVCTVHTMAPLSAASSSTIAVAEMSRKVVDGNVYSPSVRVTVNCRLGALTAAMEVAPSGQRISSRSSRAPAGKPKCSRGGSPLR